MEQTVTERRTKRRFLSPSSSHRLVISFINIIVVLIIASVAVGDISAAAAAATSSRTSKGTVVVVVVTAGDGDCAVVASGECSGDTGGAGADSYDLRQLVKDFTGLVNGPVAKELNNSISIMVVEVEAGGETSNIIQEVVDVMATQTVAGVITLTRGPISDEILHVMHYLNVPVIEILSSDVVFRKSSGSSHYIVPHYRYTQLQHVLTTVQHFNWTAVSLASSYEDSVRSHVTKELFKKMAFENNICTLPASLNQNVPVINLFPVSSVTTSETDVNAPEVLFFARDPQQQWNTSTMNVTDPDEHILSLSSDNTERWSTLTKAVNQSCRTYAEESDNGDSTSSASGQPIHMCSDLDSLSTTMFYFAPSFDSLVQSVSFLAKMTGMSSNTTSSCADDGISLTCLLLTSGKVTADSENILHILKNDVFHIQYMNNGSSHSANFTKLSPVSAWEYDFGDFPVSIFGKGCDTYCSYCSSCFPHKVSDIKLMSSGFGDGYIIGFFPVHHSSAQNYCSEPNPIGYAAASAFLDRVKSYGQSLPLNSSRIHGVVLDSCGSPNEVNKIMNYIKTCSHSFREDVNGIEIARSFEESSIIGYVDGMNNLGSVFPNQENMVLSIDRSGFSIALNIKQRFIENCLTTMNKIGWTVINVVLSEDRFYQEMSQFLKTSPLSNSFCFLNVVTLRSDKSVRNSDLDRIVSTSEKSPVYLLLTNHEDTGEVIRRLSNESTQISYVFTPWNEQWHTSNQVLTSSDVSIMFVSSVKSTSNDILNVISDMVTSKDTPWSQDFSDITDIYNVLHDGRYDLSLVLRATDEMLTWLEEHDPHQSTRIATSDDVSFTGLDVKAYYVTAGYTTNIARVDSQLESVEQFTGETHNTCKGWCPQCHACRTDNRAQQTNLYRNGDLILTGLFPLHTVGAAGSAFTCGSMHEDAPSLQLVQAFMFAIETAQRRYHDLLPSLSVGGLVLDSCSSSLSALKVYGDFDTCTANFGGPVTGNADVPGTQTREFQSNTNFANPTKNVAFVVDGSHEDSGMMRNVLKNSRYGDAVFAHDDVASRRSARSNSQLSSAIVKILTNMNWDKVVVLTEKLHHFIEQADALLAEMQRSKLCLLTAIKFVSGDYWKVSKSLESYTKIPVVLLAKRDTARILFRWINEEIASYYWIIPVTNDEDEWGDFVQNPEHLPLGSLVVEGRPKQNDLFRNFIDNSTKGNDYTSSLSPWFKDFWRLRFSCFFLVDNYRGMNAARECPTVASLSDSQNIDPAAFEVIKYVDAVLHGLHEEYETKCPEMSGICEDFANELLKGQLTFLRGVSFSYQGEQLEYISDGEFISTLSIFNAQKDGVVKVGSFFKFSISFDASKVKLYTTNGQELTEIPKTECTSDCICIHVTVGNLSQMKNFPDYLYWNTQDEFITEIWAIVIVAVAGVGSFLTLVCAVYVVYKVFRGALGRRYVGLGLLLLFSVMVLYFTVLPFVFTPSEAVCGLRYFMSGFSYSFCFAIILVKLMSLQNYKMIGLGGEVPGINQFLSVFFVTGVQIAIGVQWWVHSSPSVHTSLDNKGTELYACSFDHEDFAVYHVYVMFLIVVCSLYAIFVRNEKKNLGEAKLLLISCWVCVAIWVAWILCFFLVDHEWSDVIICAAILACASAIMFIVFIPKIRMVSRLKYDLSNKVNFRNGYSVDTDFLYERPYSLPGTLTSTFSSAKMNYPKTYSNFDSEVNY